MPSNTILPKWIQEQLPQGTESIWFESSLGKIHALHRGRGRQVVLMHGNPTWGYLWRKVMNELPVDQFEVFAPDLMNLGYSDDLSDENFTLNNHVTAISEFYRKNIKPGAILVVQDWGGPIGLLAASRCPEIFSGILILNTGLGPPQKGARKPLFHLLAHTPILGDLAFGVFGFPMRALHQAQHDPSSIRGIVARSYRAPITMGRRKVPMKYAKMIPFEENHPSRPMFVELEKFIQSLKNVEFVWGIDDPVLGRHLKNIKPLLPHAKVTEVRAGHFLQEEAFLEIAAAITRL